MIYIKYTSRICPYYWYIWQHKKGDIRQHFVIALYPYFNKNSSIPIDLIGHNKYFIIEYLTQEEVDLIKLELL